MSSRSNVASSSTTATTMRFAVRRQERMRGAGKHEIVQRNYQFTNPKSNNRRRSRPPSSVASPTSTSTPTQYGTRRTSKTSFNASSSPAAAAARLQPRQIVLSTPMRFNTGVASTPAMSVQSGRGLIPSSSPSKYIDPRLLADQSHTSLALQTATASDPSMHRVPVGKTISERRQERMRGAGTHQIEAKDVHFGGVGGRKSSHGSEEEEEEDVVDDAFITPSSSSRNGWKSPAGSLDHFMEVLSHKSQNRAASSTDPSENNNQAAGQGTSSWIEQRRMERRRGAGTHAIEKRSIVFANPSSRLSYSSSSALYSESIAEEEEEEEGGRGGEDSVSTLPASTSFSFQAPKQSTPVIDGTGFSYHDDSEIHMDMDAPEGDFEGELGQSSNNNNDNNDDILMDSPGSIAARRAMEKRKKKRQPSPRRNVQRKVAKTGKSAQPRRTTRRVIDLAAGADETVAGEADVTLQEQREAIYTAPQPPNWTLPKKPVSKEELVEMKSQVKEMVTLALGREAGGVRNVKVNDADVLWSVVKKELNNLARQSHSKGIQQSLDQISSSLLTTFTHLSRQSAERSQLITHLQQARRRNFDLRKQVFKRRSHVLQVTRTMQVLKKQELVRVQREEDEDDSIAFLTRLQQASHEWC